MKLEHFALNVKEPLAMADWYVEHLGMTVVKQLKEPPYMTFIADDSGKMMIEIYNNNEAEIPDYASMNPLIVHLAFVSDDPDADSKRLQEAGAVELSNQTLVDGSHLVMMRDPWGLSVQLCKRAIPMLK